MAGHIGSSSNIHWNTPHWVKDGLLYVFDGPPDLDPCSNATSIIGAKTSYILPANDGLVDRWDVNGPRTTCFVNMPFGKTYMKPNRSDIIGAKDFQYLKKTHPHLADEYSIHTSIVNWVNRCNSEWHHTGINTVALLPAAVDTKHWQDTIFPSSTARCFIRGRMRFLMPNGEPGGPCPMAMALVYWGDRPDRFKEAYAKKGRVE